MEQEEVWDAIAPVWNKVKTRVDEDSVKFLKGESGKILDFGCGSGRNFSAFSVESKIYGIDFSKEMLKLAEKNAKKKGLWFKAIYSDSDKIGLDDDFFDSEICVAVLHCVKGMEKRRGILSELYRVLKPGGKALISVWSRNSPRLKNRDKETFVSWTSAGVKERYTYIYDFEEFVGDLKSVGFEILNVEEGMNIVAVVEK